VSQLLNSAGFEVTQATDLTRNDMVRVVQDFPPRSPSAARPVAMIYYAGHGVQVGGENYLLPVDAKISPVRSRRQLAAAGRRDGHAGTIPSRMRIVVLDACRNNPFPRSTTPDGPGHRRCAERLDRRLLDRAGMEAQDGDGNHSPYTSAFLNIAREPNLPIEQLFKRVRLEVNHATSGARRRGKARR
jgi:uncharacterized caspase-like protein